MYGRTYTHPNTYTYTHTYKYTCMHRYIKLLAEFTTFATGCVLKKPVEIEKQGNTF
jgi:hypothetical protein